MLRHEPESRCDDVESVCEAELRAGYGTGSLRPPERKGSGFEVLGEPAVLAMRLSGAVAGALISLAFLWPKTGREAAARAFAGVVSGLVFGPAAALVLVRRLQLETALSPAEAMLSGAALASVSAWWALGALARFAERAGAGRLKSSMAEGKDRNRDEAG